MVTRGAQTVRYHSERRPVRVDENGVTLWRATYDENGSRRKRLDAVGTIHYFDLEVPMPTVGPTELIIVLVIVMFLFGAGKLPEVGSALGRGIREFREATREEKPPSPDV